MQFIDDAAGFDRQNTDLEGRIYFDSIITGGITFFVAAEVGLINFLAGGNVGYTIVLNVAGAIAFDASPLVGRAIYQARRLFGSDNEVVYRPSQPRRYSCFPNAQTCHTSRGPVRPIHDLSAALREHIMDRERPKTDLRDPTLYD